MFAEVEHIIRGFFVNKAGAVPEKALNLELTRRVPS